MFETFLPFATALKNSFEKSNLLVSATINVPESFNYTENNIVHLSNTLDFVTVVHEFTRRSDTYKIDDAIKSLKIYTDKIKLERLLRSGVLLSKVVFGVHLTGPAFGLSASGKDEDAKFQKVHGYGAVCKAKSVHPEKWQNSSITSGVSVLRKGGKPSLVIPMENSRSIANKVRFATKRGFGGIALIDTVHDDFDGNCDVDDTFVDFKSDKGIRLNVPQHDNAVPLLRTVNEAISVTLDEIKQEASLRETTTTTTPTTTSTQTPEVNQPTQPGK